MMNETKQSNQQRVRRLGRYVWFGLLGCLLLFVSLPWVIAATPLRNWVLTQIVKDPNTVVTANGASFGWFSPLGLDQLAVRQGDGRLKVSVDRIAADRSCLQLLWSQPDLGTFEVDRPHIDITLPYLRPISAPDTQSPATQAPRALTLTAIIKAASVVIRDQSREVPLAELPGADFTVRVQGAAGDRELVIEPTVVLDHQEVTPELCDRGLQLVAPILASTTHVGGQVSLEIERFRVPLDLPEGPSRDARTEILGTVSLHHVTAGLKNELLAKLAQRLSKLFGVESPQTVRVVDNTQVQIQIRDGRVYQDGLAFLFPELSPDVILKTRGSVGLDNTLDLIVEIPSPLDLLGIRRSPETAEPDGPRTLELHVTGTLEKPQVGFPSDRQWWSELANLIDSGDEDSTGDVPVDAVLDAFGDALERWREARTDGDAPVLDRMREMRDAREAESRSLLEQWRQRRQSRLQGATPSGEETDPSTPPRGGLFRRRPS